MVWGKEHRLRISFLAPSRSLCVTLGEPPNLSGPVSLFIKLDKAPFLAGWPGGRTHCRPL